MVGQYVMTENELLKQRPTPDSVGMGSYSIDSHNVQRYITPDGHVQNEGDIGVRTNGPYAIAYGSLAAEASGVRQPARAGVRLQLAHRLRLDPHGAGVHDPRPIRRHGRVAGDRCEDSRARSGLRRALQTFARRWAGSRIRAGALSTSLLIDNLPLPPGEGWGEGCPDVTQQSSPKPLQWFIRIRFDICE